jgi:gliding motility-associated-like protein
MEATSCILLAPSRKLINFSTMIRPFLLVALLGAAFPILLLGHDHGSALQFHENKGQWPGHVLYRTLTPGGAFYVERGGFTHLLYKGGLLEGHGDPDHVDTPLLMHAVKVTFEGGHAARGAGSHRMPHYVNYFLGNDPQQWGTGCAAFAQIGLEEVYPGVGLRVDGHNGLKYDWLVAAGADPSRIIMRYEGQDELSLSGGMLFMRTSAGDVIEQRPVAWQEIAGERVPVRCEFALRRDRVTFELPDGHDPQYPLVIDPVLVFASYSGSAANDWGTTATYDAAGHLYAGSMTFGTGYPVTTGVVQPTFMGGIDMSISKFASNGTTLVWSTYLGGSATEVPHSLVVNSANELYILGTTSSTNFPTTTGAFQTSFQGGSFVSAVSSVDYVNGSDMVVVRLNEMATSLIASTYVGGSGNDGLNSAPPLRHNYGDAMRGEIIMDHNEHPIVASCTNSANMPTTPGAAQPGHAGAMDAYLFRMDPELMAMEWATYHGGMNNDAAYSVQISSTGVIYATGGTVSNNLPVTSGAYSTTLNGMTDGFIARYAADGALLSSTYIGTAQYDQCFFVQLDEEDDVYVFGQTDKDGNYPVSPGVYSNAQATQFVHKLSPDLSTSIWSTRVGRNNVGMFNGENLVPTAFLVSVCGQIYLSAWGGPTNSPVPSTTTGLPVTPDAFQPMTNGGDFYLMVLEPQAVALNYATFFGGSTTNDHVDGGTSRFDKNGVVYQAVCAGCWADNSFPTTPGAWSNTNNAGSGACNLGVFKIDFEQAVQVGIQVQAPGEILTGQEVTICVSVPITFSAVGTAGTWIWDLGIGEGEVTANAIDHTYAETGTYEVQLIGIDDASCNFSDTTYVTVVVQAPAALEPSFDPVVTSSCQGFQVQFNNTSTGSTEFSWQFGDGSTAIISDPAHAYQLPGTYEVILEMFDVICPASESIAFDLVLEPPVIEMDLDSPVALCEGDPVILDAGPGQQVYQWSTGAFTQSILVQDPGTYHVHVTDGICQGSDTIVVLDPPNYPPAEDLRACPGMDIQLMPPFETSSVIWNTGETTHAIVPELGGTYWFDAYDIHGCFFTDTMEVLIATQGDGIATIPNVFSPNNDLNNDVFMVTGLALEQFQMEIYDRWGTRVYSATEPTRGWNGGRNNTSDSMPEGTYFYMITFRDRCTNDPLTTHQGHVMLVR